MHKNRDFFKENKIVILLFVLSFVAFLISSVWGHRGVFFDTPGIFLSTIRPMTSNPDFHGYLYHHDPTTRYFSFILQVLPFNIFLPLVKTLPEMLNLFTLSHFIMPFLCLILNYFIARRTGRYDIAVAGLLLYTLFMIPGISWVCREIYMAVMPQIGLLMYFLSDKKLTKIDKICYAILIIYMFESFETTALLGLILFISGLFYYKKDKINNKSKFTIGNVGLLIFAYISIKTINVLNNSFYKLEVSGGEWLFAIKSAFFALINFNNYLIWTIIGIVLCIVFFYKNRKLGLSDLKLLGITILLAIPIIYRCTYFIPAPGMESQFFAFSMIIPPLIYASFILFDYFEIKTTNNYLYSNLIAIACIIGILQFLLQINSSYISFKYVSYLKTFLSKSTKTIDEMHIEPSMAEVSYDSGFGSMHRSVIYSPKHKVKTILFPDKDFVDFHEIDYNSTYYDKNWDIIYLQGVVLRRETQYWDLTEIVKEFEAQNIKYNNIYYKVK